jgi:ankyrin repeat protein
MSEVDPSLIEPLPSYDQNQLPQNPFDAVLTRIVISTSNPNARVTLESFIESQKAPAYSGSQSAEAPKPIEEYPMGTELLTRVKQQIVVELFRAIRREDSESISLLIQNNLVTANTRSETGRTPLLEAISTKIIHLVKELLDFGADPNAFGVVVRFFSST